MTFAFYTNTVSPHQLPLARALVARLGAENYRYIHTDELPPDRLKLGWSGGREPWIIKAGGDDAQRWLRDADVVMMQHPRDWALFEERFSRGKRCIYVSERWFKPPFGFLRILHPAYFRMAWRFVHRIMPSAAFTYLADGVHAARDMARLCGVMHGDLRCLFRAPRLDFEKMPGGRISLRSVRAGSTGKKYCLGKTRIWGYFVNEGSGNREEGRAPNDVLRILWVGRFLKWKRVDTIINAVGAIDRALLDIYGTGPKEAKLKKLAAKYGDKIRFHQPVSIDNVRKLMREHDVYVLSSNGCEGWGAVVGEAIAEGMTVIGTCEAGASATMLPDKCLFRAGNYKKLIELLSNNSLSKVDNTVWTPFHAADVLTCDILGDGSAAAPCKNISVSA